MRGSESVRTGAAAVLALVALITCGCSATESGESTTLSPEIAAGVDCVAAIQAAAGSRGVGASWDQAAAELRYRISAGGDPRLLDAVAELETSSGADSPDAASDDTFVSSCEIAFEVDLS
jgi:hypothetical protein